MFGSFMPFLHHRVTKPPLATSFESRVDLLNSGTTSASINAPIGNKAKLIIGVYCFNPSLSINAFKVGVNTAKLIGEQINGFSLWIVDKPAGTTATFAINLPSSTSAAWSCAIWGVDGIDGDVSSQILTSAATPSAVSMPVLAGGIILAMSTPSANGLTTWSGLPSIDVVNHAVSGTSTRRFNAARGEFISNQNVSITATYSSSGAGRFMFAASLR